MNVTPLRLSEDIDYAKFIGRQESQHLRTTTDFSDALRNRHSSGVYGDTLPWIHTHQHFRFRPGEVTLWCGITRHGKSMVLSQVIAWLIPYVNCCVASLEMSPVDQLDRMVKQCSGTDDYSDAYASQWLKDMEGRLWIYDQLGQVSADRVLGVAYYTASELNCQHMVIDSLMKVGSIKKDDYAKQVEFVNDLTVAAKAVNSHIHLVAHMSTKEDETQEPKISSIRGAGEIVEQVDNAIVVHRNIGKERKIESGDESVGDVYDATLRVLKQRNFNWSGRWPLWFHNRSLQYHGRPSHQAMIWKGTAENSQSARR